MSVERRVSLEEVAKAIKAAHPTWSEFKVACAAKQEWHKHAEQKGESRGKTNKEG